jgi:D-alanyl-lipoteichoic acid acyltransferase DltB (MBOAT superfamily)
VLTIGVICNIAFILVLKYANFFGGTINTIFGANLPELSIIQPLGISFYTLQAISYITDIYRGRYEACKNPLKIVLYLSFMLTIVEGPIARYDQLGTQLSEGRKFELKNLVSGAQLVVWGLFKKVVIADRAAELVNNVFDEPHFESGMIVLAAILFYTLQLYCDFSGIMDVINGLGEMMGIEMPKNFNRPFFAKTINEFWQRWHITLGGWLRDYIFYPISLSKPFMKLTKSARKKFNPYYANLIPTAIALFFVWFTNGMWHGAAWKYIVYGLYYYVLMMLGLFAEPLSAKVCKKLKINRKSKGFKLFQMVRTFAIVNIGMLIFRADSLKTVFLAIKTIILNPNFSSLAVGSKNGLGLDLKDYAILIIGTVLIFFVGVLQEWGIGIRQLISQKPLISKFIIYMIAILSVILLGAYGEHYGAVDLLYANF